MSRKGEILFLHPDLGVGGAERLVVDAAIALQNAGHNVSFITSYHNPNHCFEETKDGTLRVDVVGEWIPRQIFGRFFALCAYLKIIYCSLYIVLFRRPDIVFCDLVSAGIPFLKLRSVKVVFYCHFPDQLLSKEEGALKGMYRFVLNWLEEATTGLADKVYVNSKFTKSVFQKTFKSLAVEPDVLYPSINTKSYDDTLIDNRSPDEFVFLSINRYERKKHVEIAVKAMKTIVESAPNGTSVKLQIVGGYDPRVEENVDYFEELKSLVASLDLVDRVEFFKSPSDAEKCDLLKNCSCLVYTPPNEHFGIVPLEAMFLKKPVVACNSGGPTETVLHEKTGILCDFEPKAFAGAMSRLLTNETFRRSLGEEGRKRFENMFSFEAFSDKLCREVNCLLEPVDRNR